MDRRLKGVSLSVETIIVIVICILVLVLMAVFFLNTSNPATSQITSDAQLNAECSNWRNYGHDFNRFNATTYPGLYEKYKLAPIAASYCEGMVAKNYIDCSMQCQKIITDSSGTRTENVDCCAGTNPHQGEWVCYCEGTSTADCKDKKDCKWAPRGGI